jgi:hypothetical protein
MPTCYGCVLHFPPGDLPARTFGAEAHSSCCEGLARRADQRASGPAVSCNRQVVPALRSASLIAYGLCTPNPLTRLMLVCFSVGHFGSHCCRRHEPPPSRHHAASDPCDGKASVACVCWMVAVGHCHPVWASDGMSYGGRRSIHSCAVAPARRSVRRKLPLRPLNRLVRVPKQCCCWL